MKNRELTHGFSGSISRREYPAPHVDKGRNSDYHAFGNSVEIRIFSESYMQRPVYLEALKRKKENSLVKVITGIRRCGKSYLLFTLYHEYLNSIGVKDEQIIELALDDDENIQYRNPLELGKFIRSKISDNEKMYYVFLDEIQKVAEIKNPYLPDSEEKITFVDTLNGLMKIKNVDIYVTGSNSKMLSSDILTEFRGRGDEIRVHPLSYREFSSAYMGKNAWYEYMTYGGMPFLMQLDSAQDKSKYLHDLFDKIYLSDVMARNKILSEKGTLDDLLDFSASSVGSLVNATTLANTFKSVKKKKIDDETVRTYLGHFAEAFMIEQVKRYDVKGKKHIGALYKYYFEDVGLRNARLNFRQQEENHIMENIVFNELKIRGYDVDVGAYEYNSKNSLGQSIRTKLEVDFVASRGSEKIYIQVALSVASEEKRQQEINSLRRIKDSFRKLVLVKEPVVPWQDENGIEYMGIEQWLLGNDEVAL